MGSIVSAAEAAALVGRHERMVRWHIEHRDRRTGQMVGDLPARKTKQGQWQIDTDDLARVPGWTVDRERLARLELRHSRSYGGLVARVEALERRIRSLESEIARLEGLEQAHHPAPEEEQGEPDPRPAAQWLPTTLADYPAPPPTYRGPSTVRLADRGPDAPQMFSTAADAARWLERHGVNALTPKSWPNWKHVTLTPGEVLAFALERQRASAGNWRVTWRLHRCHDAACVCQEVLTTPAPQPDGWQEGRTGFPALDLEPLAR